MRFRPSPALATVGVAPTLGPLLLIIVSGIAIKNLLIFIAEQRIGYIAADVATELRMSLLRGMIASRWAFFTRQSGGALANAMATEAWRASNAYVFAVRVLASVVGEDGLAETDRRYLAFGAQFEQHLISQAQPRTLEDSMDAGWVLLRTLPPGELTRLSDRQIAEHIAAGQGEEAAA